MKYIWLMVLVLAATAQAEWGRMFYTPQERRQIESGQGVGGAAPVEPGVRHYNGKVIQPDGKVRHWVGGETSKRQPPPQVKPGESWEPATGKVYPTGRGPGG